MDRIPDSLERVAWTGIQAAAGAAIDVGTSGEMSWRALGYAVGIAVLKVVAAPWIGGKRGRSIP